MSVSGGQGSRRGSGRFSPRATAFAVAAGAALTVCVAGVLCSSAGRADNDSSAERRSAFPTVRERVAVQAQQSTRYVDENGIEQNGLSSASPIEGGRLITTPRYTLEVPDDAFPQGYSWEFAHSGMACAPDGVWDVLVLTDAATGRPGLMAYCAGISLEEFRTSAGWADGRIGEEFLPCPEGYWIATTGDVTNMGMSSEMAFVAIVLPEERASADEAKAWRGRMDTMGGSYNLIQGIEGATASPEAYIAHATAEDGRLRVTTSFYTVLLPEGWTADSCLCSFDSHYWQPSGYELRIFRDGRMFHVFLREADKGFNIDPDYPEVVAAVVSDGRELVVSGMAGDDPTVGAECLDELAAGVSLL